MKALFVMPHYACGGEHSIRYLKEAISSVLNQSESDWHLIIIDDASSDRESIDYLKFIKSIHPNDITLIFNVENIGPGGSRNKAIEFAYQNQYDLIFYIDADDICHPDRLRICREIFYKNSSVDLVYSSFSIIDENSNAVDHHMLSGSIQEIIEGHSNPPQGNNAWIDIAVRTGYTNLTSATAIRTELAHRFPFPQFKVSEDMHTWLRCSAGGREFAFCSSKLTKYRIPQKTKVTASRLREGGESSFYTLKAEADEEGFKMAYIEALKLGKIDANIYKQLFSMFYQKLAVTLIRVSQYELAIQQIKKSQDLYKEIFTELTVS